ncbi:hypothetical protein Pyn_17959 [Prunus yedoensis var. nudiflora]|uniref:Uncharacterized protein n=1 Tax=Prunus yedoensis var. nudiflora TaxID=2094558 RepID=A0A314ZIU1_PRUYE|nr:hypothetical protein Pyn_15669 [Prunus yedoensis var. nudiflora]PQQ21372.1 hypothetical protein Pyn_17959 [Prunus yedoensis var. nudiflora]
MSRPDPASSGSPPSLFTNKLAHFGESDGKISTRSLWGGLAIWVGHFHGLDGFCPEFQTMNA